MNLFIVIIPILFQILIVILAGLAWFSFIKNILGGSTKNRNASRPNRRGVQPGQRQRIDVTRTNPSTAQSQRTSSQRPLLKGSSSTPLNAKNVVENLFKQTPQELYHLLVNNLPKTYHNDVKAIFNSQSWKRNLWNFVRRKDVWPLIQDALKSEVSERIEQVDEIKPYPRNKPKVREEQMHMQTNQESIFESDFEEDYDSFARMYDDISNALTFDSLTPVVEEKLVVSKQQSEKNHKLTINKKWLKNAIISKEILGRQDY